MSESFVHDGTRFTYEQRNAETTGPPLVFQHGMGADLHQPLGFVQPLTTTRVVSLDARGHGGTDSVDDHRKVNFSTFGDDVIALMNHLNIDQFIVGGISMGAGTALDVALRYPHRIRGLVLCRPAWLDGPQDSWNRSAYERIADLLERHETDEALRKFLDSDTYRDVAAVSEAAAASLRHQITRDRARENAVILRRLPADRPSTTSRQWQTTAAPTLIMGHRDDPFHPFSIAETYGREIPSSRFVEITSKDKSTVEFQRDIERTLQEFVQTPGGDDTHGHA